MSDISKKFYNLFWQNKTCQNLFLLSKEELLDTTTIGSGEKTLSYSLPRIIISNAHDSENVETIKIRTENLNISLDNSLGDKIEFFKPLIEQFFNSKFKKSFDKLSLDIETKGLSVIGKIIRILSSEKNRERNIVLFLQDYGFVGRHINNFKEIEEDLKHQFSPKKSNELINEHTLRTFFEGIKFAKELYVNHSYKKLYSTNQVLTNTLNREDDFQSRIKLFHYLYESGILTPSKEDAFIECSNCEPGTYRGVFQLRLNPKKLQELKCPVCSRELTYFVPYELHNDIYDIVKSQDGLLLDAYCNTLQKLNINYLVNQKFLQDIEIDCIFAIDDKTYIVESKMYKQNTTHEKLQVKLRGHFGKLLRDTQRIQGLPQFKNKILMPILLTNIIDTEFIKSVEKDLKNTTVPELVVNARIFNIELLKVNN